MNINLIKELEKRYLFNNVKNPIIKCVMLLDTITFKVYLSASLCRTKSILIS